MSRSVSTLKFVGTISLGLLTGLSYTLSTLTLPTLLTLPSASSAARAFTTLTGRALTHIRTLSAISGISFLLAYLLSPRPSQHPYLVWTTLFIAGSSASDLLMRPSTKKSIAAQKQKERDRKGKGKQQMDASFEVVGGADSNSEGTPSEHENEGDGEVMVNGEEVRAAVEGFTVSQVVRTGIAGVAFAMSVIGIWGDGAVESFIVVEM